MQFASLVESELERVVIDAPLFLLPLPLPPLPPLPPFPLFLLLLLLPPFPFPLFPLLLELPELMYRGTGAGVGLLVGALVES
jgi:hypothetical protein